MPNARPDQAARIGYRGDGEAFRQDSWDGYPAGRRRVLDAMVDQGESNAVVITGDRHCAVINDLRRDSSVAVAGPKATEFTVRSCDVVSTTARLCPVAATLLFPARPAAIGIPEHPGWPQAWQRVQTL